MDLRYVNSVRKPTQQEIENAKKLNAFNDMIEKKEKRKVIARKAGNITATIVTVALLGAGTIWGIKNIPELQNAQLQQTNYEMASNTYSREISEDVRISADKEFYEAQKAESLKQQENLKVGTAEYLENQQKLEEAELKLMGINELLGENEIGHTK